MIILSQHSCSTFLPLHFKTEAKNNFQCHVCKELQGDILIKCYLIRLAISSSGMIEGCQSGQPLLVANTTKLLVPVNVGLQGWLHFTVISSMLAPFQSTFWLLGFEIIGQSSSLAKHTWLPCHFLPECQKVQC